MSRSRVLFALFVLVAIVAACASQPTTEKEVKEAIRAHSSGEATDGTAPPSGR